MEKKEPIKVSLSTVFLIISIIIIGVMGYFIYKLYNDKNIEANKATELEKKLENLNSTITDLQGKINSDNETISANNTNQNINNTAEFTDDQVKKAIADYLELNACADCDNLLTKLTEKGQINSDSSKYTNASTGEVITNVKFSDYKKAMLNYVTEAEFERNWTSKQHFKENANGYLTKMEGGGGLRIYTIKNISKIDKSTFNVKTSSAVDGNEYYEENTYTFTVKSNNGNCVIDNCK